MTSAFLGCLPSNPPTFVSPMFNTPKNWEVVMTRSYAHENTPSHQHRAVKRVSAGVVVGRVITCEFPVTCCFWIWILFESSLTPGVTHYCYHPTRCRVRHTGLLLACAGGEENNAERGGMMADTRASPESQFTDSHHQDMFETHGERVCRKQSHLLLDNSEFPQCSNPDGEAGVGTLDCAPYCMQHTHSIDGQHTVAS